MNRTKKRTVNIDLQSIKFFPAGGDQHGGILRIEEWRNGTLIVIRVAVTRHWQLKQIKKSLNSLVDHEVSTADKFADALASDEFN